MVCFFRKRMETSSSPLFRGPLCIEALSRDWTAMLDLDEIANRR
jgi:hypothetical protein